MSWKAIKIGQIAMVYEVAQALRFDNVSQTLSGIFVI